MGFHSALFVRLKVNIESYLQFELDITQNKDKNI